MSSSRTGDDARVVDLGTHLCRENEGDLEAKTSRIVLIVGADALLCDLLSEWMAELGFRGAILPPHSGLSCPACELILVEIAYPRQSALRILERMAGEYPGVPIVAMSTGFFPSVAASRPAARLLGAAYVLPIPVAKEIFLNAVKQILDANR